MRRREFKSHRISNLQQSEIRRMTRECLSVHGLNLGQGVCDLPTPPIVLEAAVSAIERDCSCYSKPEGIAALRSAVAGKMAAYNALLQVDPETDVMVSIGATGAFNCAIHALLNPGDEVIIFEPYYGYHVNMLRIAGLQPVLVPLSAPAWRLNAKDIEAKLTARTRAVVVNTPGNPAGNVFSAADLAVVADICQRHDLLAVTDEIYEYFVFDGRPHISLASLPGMRERTVTISGLSKTFSITGWRLGYAVAAPHLIEPMNLVNDLMYVCAPTPLQHAVAAGICDLPSDYYAGIAAEFEAKRDMFCDTLDAIGLTSNRPGGAYYVLADIRKLNCQNDRDAAMYILKHTGVASIPGSAFYESETGKTLIRFCFAQDWEVLEDACSRLSALRVCR